MSGESLAYLRAFHRAAQMNMREEIPRAASSVIVHEEGREYPIQLAELGGNAIALRENRRAWMHAQERIAAELTRLSNLVRWLRQTIHQAHHEGPIDGCKIATCAAITRTLHETS